MLIGISGEAGAGKDTIAEVFIKKHGFIRVSFADKLKEICSKVFSIDSSYFYDTILKDKLFETTIACNVNHIESLCNLLSDEGIIITKTQKDLLLEHGQNLQFVSPRHVLQIVGTDLCRKYVSDSVWIDIFKNTISKKEGLYICSDARYRNEREVIKDLKGINLLVVRPNNVKVLEHESEKLANDPYLIDVTIVNDSTKSVLQEQVSIWWNNKVREYRL